MISRVFSFAAATVALIACERVPEDPPPVTPQTVAAVDDTPDGSQAPTRSSLPTVASTPGPRLVAEAIVLREWQRAENRESCAPLAFASTGQARGAPRPADFGGGWGVAFDLPNMRSAYGLAGPGTVAADRALPDEQRQRLRGQWPYFRELDALPQPAFAGYGIEGDKAYPDDNPSGRGINTLAYVRTGEQQCTYNVWSRLGRAHLETLLDALRAARVD